MFKKWRTRWPPKHKIPNIFFNIQARIIILVSTYRFWGVKEFNKHVKIDLKAHRLHKMADKMADEATATECPKNAPFGTRIQDSSLETQILKL